MGKYRTLSENNKYYLPKHTYLACIHYALQYRDWKASLDADRDTRGAIRYDKDRVQTSGDYDSTSETAIRMTEIAEKCATIDKCISIACDGSNLEDQGIPCGKKMYYDIRQRFYYELGKKI